MSAGEVKHDQKDFEPLHIMGIFWFAFGVFVLFATFFVKGTEQVPLVRSVITNLSAGFLLLAAGVGSILKANANKRKKLAKS